MKNTKQIKKINLALQGGGAFAAFAWGALDRFLEDDRISIDGISATSAGSVNAVALAQGYIKGGREGARQTLHDLWKAISIAGTNTGMNYKSPIEDMFSELIPLPLTLIAFQQMFKNFSPYQFNPLNINPLKEILEKFINVEEIKSKSDLHLYIGATNVKSGKIHVFDKEHLSINAVLASACMPYLFQAVEVNNEFYWDGGYVGNPAIYPLIYNTESRDIVIFHLTPIERDMVPTKVEDIITRSKEISFNSSIMREIRVIDFISKILDEGYIKDEHRDRFKRIYLHSIEPGNALNVQPMLNMLNTDWTFLMSLYQNGRNASSLWLEQNFDALGNKTTIDLKKWI